MLLWNVDASQRTRLIATSSQRSDGRCFLFGGVPDDLIHSRCPFALVFRHSSHGKGFAAERVGQEPLQSFHLAIASRLCCLHDTGLQPTHSLVHVLPVNGMPLDLTAGGRTSRGFCHHLLVLLNQFDNSSREERPKAEVCPLSRGGMFHRLSVRLRNGIRFFRCPIPAIPLVNLTVFYPFGRMTGLPCSA